MKNILKSTMLILMAAAVLITASFAVSADDTVDYGTAEKGVYSSRNNYMYSTTPYLDGPTNLNFAEGLKYWGSSMGTKFASDVGKIFDIDGRKAFKFTNLEKEWDGIVTWSFMINDAHEGSKFAVIYEYKGDISNHQIKISGDGKNGWLCGGFTTLVDYEDPDKWNVGMSPATSELNPLKDEASSYHFNLHLQYGADPENYADCYIANLQVVRYSSNTDIYDLSGKKLVFEQPDLSANGATQDDGYSEANNAVLDDGTKEAGTEKNAAVSVSENKENSDTSDNSGMPVWAIVLIVVGGVVVVAGVTVAVILVLKKKKMSQIAAGDAPESEVVSQGNSDGNGTGNETEEGKK